MLALELLSMTRCDVRYRSSSMPGGYLKFTALLYKSRLLPYLSTNSNELYHSQNTYASILASMQNPDEITTWAEFRAAVWNEFFVITTPSSTAICRKWEKTKRSTNRKDGYDVTKAYDLHAFGLCFIPPFIFWMVVSVLYNGTEEVDVIDLYRQDVPQRGLSRLAGCDPWFPGTLANNTSGCEFKDFIERPSWPIHAPILVALILGTMIFHRSPTNLKRFAFGFNFIITSAIRCLSSFSGRMALSTWSFLPWNSNSAAKAFFMWFLVELGIWNCSYLGTYVDVRLEKVRLLNNTSFDTMITALQESQSAIDEYGNTVWTPEYKRKDPIFSSHYFPWQDTVVRLSYIHIIDNLIHIVWLRFFFENGPYSTYINNSEILTVYLAVGVAFYTYARIDSRALFQNEDDEEMALGEGKLGENEITDMMATKSATKGLMSVSSKDLAFRKLGLWHQFGILMACCFVVVHILVVELDDPRLTYALICAPDVIRLMY